MIVLSGTHCHNLQWTTTFQMQETNFSLISSRFNVCCQSGKFPYLNVYTNLDQQPLLPLQVISPALGAYLHQAYGDTVIVALATAIAVLDVFFILVAVPESLPEKVRPSSWGAPISWEQADPFSVIFCRHRNALGVC